MMRCLELEFSSLVFCLFCLHQVEKQDGRVFGVERLRALAQFATKNLQRADGDLLDQGIVSVVCE